MVIGLPIVGAATGQDPSGEDDQLARVAAKDHSPLADAKAIVGRGPLQADHACRVACRKAVNGDDDAPAIGGSNPPRSFSAVAYTGPARGGGHSIPSDVLSSSAERVSPDAPSRSNCASASISSGCGGSDGAWSSIRATGSPDAAASDWSAAAASGSDIASTAACKRSLTETVSMVSARWTRQYETAGMSARNASLDGVGIDRRTHAQPWRPEGVMCGAGRCGSTTVPPFVGGCVRRADVRPVG